MTGPPGTDALRWMMLVVKRCAWAIGERERPYKARCELSCTDAAGDGDPVVVLADDGPDPLRSLERADRHSARKEALTRLKPDERTALVLFGLGYSYREIRELRGWTQAKVNRCLVEGRASLRSAAEDMEET
jgi:DNA-directed RNA polymerase specialized sigma24 family protein